MRVLLDANIWIAEHLLRSALGAALIFALKRSNGKILLPRVTEQEAVKGIVKVGEAAISQVRKSFLTIQSIVGRIPEYEPPSHEEIEGHAMSRLAELSAFITTIESSLAVYDAALARVLQGRPPNKRNEQFRDSMVWETLLQQDPGTPIYFVTRDTDFFEGPGLDSALAHELTQEIIERQLEVRVHRTVEHLLSSLNGSVLKADTAEIRAALVVALEKELLSVSQTCRYDLQAFRDGTVEVFLTEDHNVLAVSFEFTYDIANLIGPDDTLEQAATLTVKGNASYSIDAKAISQVRLGSATAYTLNGTMIPRNSIGFAYSNIVLGTRQIPYAIRRRL